MLGKLDLRSLIVNDLIKHMQSEDVVIKEKSFNFLSWIVITNSLEEGDGVYKAISMSGLTHILSSLLEYLKHNQIREKGFGVGALAFASHILPIEERNQICQSIVNDPELKGALATFFKDERNFIDSMLERLEYPHQERHILNIILDVLYESIITPTSNKGEVSIFDSLIQIEGASPILAKCVRASEHSIRVKAIFLMHYLALHIGAGPAVSDIFKPFSSYPQDLTADNALRAAILAMRSKYNELLADKPKLGATEGMAEAIEELALALSEDHPEVTNCVADIFLHLCTSEEGRGLILATQNTLDRLTAAYYSKDDDCEAQLVLRKIITSLGKEACLKPRI